MTSARAAALQLTATGRSQGMPKRPRDPHYIPPGLCHWRAGSVAISRLRGYRPRRAMNSPRARKAYRLNMSNTPPVARGSDPNSVPAASTVPTRCSSGPLKAAAMVARASLAAGPRVASTPPSTARRPSSPRRLCVTTTATTASRMTLGLGGRGRGSGGSAGMREGGPAGVPLAVTLQARALVRRGARGELRRSGATARLLSMSCAVAPSAVSGDANCTQLALAGAARRSASMWTPG
eukprot:scaffold14363_cov111-Isochrysis_galbana.AAC.7